MGSLRACPSEAIHLVKLCEGFVPHVYVCPAGYPTIGYGHVVRPGEDWSRGITQDEATRLLVEVDMPIYERGVLQHILVPLPDLCYGALCSFTYNLGIGALQMSTLRKLINQNRLDEAADQFPRWVYAGATILPGLVKRRALSKAMWLKGLHG